MESLLSTESPRADLNHSATERKSKKKGTVSTKPRDTPPVSDVKGKAPRTLRERRALPHSLPKLRSATTAIRPENVNNRAVEGSPCLVIRRENNKELTNSYTLHLAEGWSVQVDSEAEAYTVSRDRRSISFDTSSPLPPCRANYNLTLERGPQKMTVPAHVVEVLQSQLGPLCATPLSAFEGKFTNQSRKRAELSGGGEAAGPPTAARGGGSPPPPKKRFVIKQEVSTNHTDDQKQFLSSNITNTNSSGSSSSIVTEVIPSPHLELGLGKEKAVIWHCSSNSTPSEESASSERTNSSRLC